ncbi:hypothetical protein MRX96_056537 [Rhipicephalus microplus]
MMQQQSDRDSNEVVTHVGQRVFTRRKTKEGTRAFLSRDASARSQSLSSRAQPGRLVWAQRQPDLIAVDLHCYKQAEYYGVRLAWLSGNLEQAEQVWERRPF